MAFGPKPPKKPDPEPEPQPPKPDPAEQYRCQRLMRLGFDSIDALHMAADRRIDIYTISQLLRRGATHTQARRIAAPVD